MSIKGLNLIQKEFFQLLDVALRVIWTRECSKLKTDYCCFAEETSLLVRRSVSLTGQRKRLFQLEQRCFVL